jgi:hypothetical protein
MAIEKNGVVVTDLSTWKELAPPKSLKQWVDGRSAKASAATRNDPGSAKKTDPPELPESALRRVYKEADWLTVQPLARSEG